MQQRNRAHHIEPATLIHSSNETTYWQRTIAYQTATAESAQALTLRLAAHIDVVLRGRASEEMKPFVRQLAAAIVVRHLRNPRSVCAEYVTQRENNNQIVLSHRVPHDVTTNTRRLAPTTTMMMVKEPVVSPVDCVVRSCPMRWDRCRQKGLTGKNLPSRVMTARSPPSGSATFFTSSLKLIALMMPSPNCSWTNCLRVAP